MRSIDDIYSGRFLKAGNLEGRWPMAVTIMKTELVRYDDGKQAIGLHLAEFPGKVLGLNKTNVERIRHSLGDDWEHGWPNNQLTLVLENVEFQGSITPAVRVQMPQLQPGPTPGDQYRAAQAGTPPPRPPGSFEEAMHNSGYGEG